MLKAVIRGIRLPVFAMVVLLCWGCATTQETQMLQRNNSLLIQQVQNLEDRVQKIERQVQGGGGEEGGKSMGLADIDSRLEELQVRLGSVSGQIENQGRQVDRMKQNMSLLESAVSSSAASKPEPDSSSAPKITIPGVEQPREGAAGAAAKTPPASPAGASSVPPQSQGAGAGSATAGSGASSKTPAAAPSGPSAAQPAAPSSAQAGPAVKSPAAPASNAGANTTASASAGASAPVPSPSASAPRSENPEKAKFDKALQMFQQGQYENARKEFQDFVGKYPTSDYAATALYYTGEAYYSEKRYNEAISSYQKILDRYPKGNRVPFALLKQANAFEKLGDSTAARILYERLVDQYPSSPQAQVAGKKLKEGR